MLTGRRHARNRSTEAFTQLVPRNYGGNDRIWLALNDGGHATSPEATNPIFFGLGATLRVQFNAFVRTWSAFVEADFGGGPLVQEITSLFRADGTIARRYYLEGAAGIFPLAPVGPTSISYNSPRVVTFRFELRNSSKTRTVRRQMVVYNAAAGAVPGGTQPLGGGIQHCPVAEDCDFGLFGPINKAGVRIFENMVDRRASAASNVQDWDLVAMAPFTPGRANQPVSFYFTTMDKLVNKIAALVAAGHLTAEDDLRALIPSFSTYGSVAVEFTNRPAVDVWNAAQHCGPSDDGETPGCPAVYCCCTFGFGAAQMTYTNITTATVAGTGTGAGVLGISAPQYHEMELSLTIPTGGGTDCLGFQGLLIRLPGLDTTNGTFALYDSGQPGSPAYGLATGFGVLVNGVLVTPTKYTQSSVETAWPGSNRPGDGSGNSMVLNFGGLPLGTCGDTVQVRFRFYSVVQTSPGQVIAAPTVSFYGSPECDPQTQPHHPPGGEHHCSCGAGTPTPPGGATPDIGTGGGDPGFRG